jgi:hypothetical protein
MRTFRFNLKQTDPQKNRRAYLMKRKILSIGAGVLLTLQTSVWAADIFGNWIAPGTLHERLRTQGNLTNTWFEAMVETVFSFKVNGTELTGTVADAEGKTAIREGKINGDEISFVVIHSVGGNERKLAYKGQVSLNEIMFTVEGQGLKGQPMEFIAKREFPRHGDIPVQPVRSMPYHR